MAVLEGGSPRRVEELLSTEDELDSKQKQEIKQLRATIQALKKSVPKGDKKKRKTVNDEISRLEKEMNEKHLREKEQLTKASCDVKGKEDIVNGKELEKMSSSIVQAEPKAEKMTKAQKRREKREREERERQERIDEAKASSGPNLRVIEEEKLLAQLKPLNFGIKEIIPDGHCLYAALGDQLGIKFGVKLPVEELRRRCADHMRSNNEEFMPFAVDHETGDPCSRDTFVKYCEDVEKTAVWGGHLEIRALSRVFNVAVSVFQADLPVLWIGEEHKENGILYLTYHHHAYGLGEHYNSVTPLS